MIDQSRQRACGSHGVARRGVSMWHWVGGTCSRWERCQARTPMLAGTLKPWVRGSEEGMVQKNTAGLCGCPCQPKCCPGTHQELPGTPQAASLGLCWVQCFLQETMKWQHLQTSKLPANSLFPFLKSQASWGCLSQEGVQRISSAKSSPHRVLSHLLCGHSC